MTGSLLRSIFFNVLVALVVAIPARGAKPPIKVCHSRDYAPFVKISSDGALEGALVEFWDLWAQKANVAVSLVTGSPATCIDRVLNGKADVVGGLFFTEERTRSLDFSDPVLAVETIVLALVGNTATTIADLTVPLGVVDGCLAHEDIRTRFPAQELVLYDTYSELVQAIRSGTTEAIVIEIPKPVMGELDIELPRDVRIVQTLSSNRLRPAIKKGNRKMRNLVLSGLNGISYEELLAISAKWMPVKAANNHWVWFFAGLVGLSFGMVLMLIILRTRRKRRLRSVLTLASLKTILAQGENDTVEFKSSFRWDLKEQRVNKVLEEVIAKAISAFLNTNGGRLVIGVADNGTPLGLKEDYQSFSKKKDADGFVLAITSLVGKYFGKHVNKFVRLQILEVDGKDVCVVTAVKSGAPVFMTKGGKEEFFIRASASSQPLGLKEAHSYISSHFR